MGLYLGLMSGAGMHAIDAAPLSIAAIRATAFERAHLGRRVPARLNALRRRRAPRGFVELS